MGQLPQNPIKKTHLQSTPKELQNSGRQVQVRDAQNSRGPQQTSASDREKSETEAEADLRHRPVLSGFDDRKAEEKEHRVQLAGGFRVQKRGRGGRGGARG